jgi:hypothetical protein
MGVLEGGVDEVDFVFELLVRVLSGRKLKVTQEVR